MFLVFNLMILIMKYIKINNKQKNKQQIKIYIKELSHDNYKHNHNSKID